MKSIIKLMVVFVCVVSLVACGRKDTTVSANKDGVLYEARPEIHSGIHAPDTP